MRGGPDPVLVVGLYAVVGDELRLIGRSLHRFESKTEFPTDVKPDVVDLPDGNVTADGALRFVVLAIMLEEDGGRDVQRFFGAVEHHDLLTLWKPRDHELEPVPLAAFAATLPSEVEVMVEGQPASATCRSDKWIGAVCWSLESRRPPSASRYRLPFLAPDRRNDWTLIVTIEH